MKKTTAATLSFWLGLGSIFLWEFSLIPLLAIGFGIWSRDKEQNPYNDGGLVGIGLGIIFLIVKIVTITNA